LEGRIAWGLAPLQLPIAGWMQSDKPKHQGKTDAQRGQEANNHRAVG
jgi:hypothetical protein